MVRDSNMIVSATTEVAKAYYYSNPVLNQLGPELLDSQTLIPADKTRDVLKSRMNGDEHTCIADLKTVGSAAYQVLETMPYPTGNRRVLWHPVSTIVGPNPPPRQVRFAEYGSLGAWYAMNHSDTEILLNAQNSDWVVSLMSQVNLTLPTSTDPKSVGSHFEGYNHSDLRFAGAIVLLGPTSAMPVAFDVWRQLSVPSNDDDFDPNWSMGR